MATWLAGRAASRQGVLGGSWTQLGSDWLACRYGGGTGDGGAHVTQVHMDSRDSGILVGGVAVGGGMGVTAARCCSQSRVRGSQWPAWRESAAQCLILPF